MRKGLSRIDLLCLVVGSIIGWGSFTLPGDKFLPESGVINTGIGLIIGGLAVTVIQKGYYIMKQNHHEDGGEFSYTFNHLGRKHGFIVGWSLLLCYLSLVPLNATAFVLVIKKLYGSRVEWLYLYDVAGYQVFLSDIILASLIIILFAYINIRGIRASSNAQNIMVLLLVLNVLAVFVMMSFKSDHAMFLTRYIVAGQLDWGEIAKVLAIVPFLFVGFDVIPQVTTELNFKAEKATRIAVISIFTGVLLYNLLNIITAFAFTPAEAVQQQWAAGSAVMNHLGKFGFLLLVIALAAAVISGINGFMLSSSKLIGALSNYGLFPAKYSDLNKKRVFENGIKFITGVSLIAPWLGREVIIYIVDMSSLLAAVAYFYVCLIGYKIALNRKDRILTLSGIGISLTFIALLIIPWSPGHLNLASIILMVVWVIVGMLYYKKMTNTAVTTS
ncbi:MAG: APC family permease [Thermoactinomyces sp.]